MKCNGGAEMISNSHQRGTSASQNYVREGGGVQPRASPCLTQGVVKGQGSLRQWSLFFHVVRHQVRHAMGR